MAGGSHLMGDHWGPHFVWRIAMLDKEKNIRHTTNSQVKRTVFPPTYFTYMYIYMYNHIMTYDLQHFSTTSL